MNINMNNYIITAAALGTCSTLYHLYQWYRSSPTTTSFLLLNDSDVAAALPVNLAIQIQNQAFQDQYNNIAVVPERIVMSLPSYNGATLFKPCFNAHPSRTALGLKVVSTRPNNKTLSLPTVPATIMMFEPSTGLPSAVLNGTYLTALRTAGGSGVATNMFAKPDATVLSVFGAGMQAKAHIDCILSVRPSITTLYIVNRTLSRATTLKKYVLAKHGCNVHVLKQATYDSVHNADVICTTTNSSTPLFDGRWLSSNTHINAIGSYTPAMQELDACTVEQCCIYIDTPHALSCGDLSMANVTKERHGLMTLGQACTMPREQLQRTLGPRERSGGGKGNDVKKHSKRFSMILNEIQQEGTLHGAPVSPRAANSSASGTEKRSAKETVLVLECITLFKSVGTSIQDIATAAVVVARAKKMGIGTQVFM